MRQKLSTKERARFDYIRSEVEKNLHTCFRIGALLAEAKADKLWREDFDTWEDFCRQSYQLGVRKAAYLISAFEVQETVKKANEEAKQTGTMVPLLTNERQARALAKVPEKDRLAVLSQAAANGPVTAKAIASAAPPAFVPPAPEFDELGCRIPGDALPFWHRRGEVQKTLTELSRIKCAVEKAKSEGDPLYGKVSNAILDHLKSCYTHLLEAKPYAVCTQCMGAFSVQPKGGCSMCGSKGLISKFQWDTQSRKEVKELRLKSISRERATA